jgi:hypothetical protein
MPTVTVLSKRVVVVYWLFTPYSRSAEPKIDKSPVAHPGPACRETPNPSSLESGLRPCPDITETLYQHAYHANDGRLAVTNLIDRLQRSASLPNHRKDGRCFINLDCSYNFESVSLVERDVRGICRLQIGDSSLTIYVLQSVA